MPRRAVHNIQLNDEDFNNLMDTAERLKGPIAINLNGPAAIRLLVSFQQGWTAEQAQKYHEAIATWSDDNE